MMADWVAGPSPADDVVSLAAADQPLAETDGLTKKFDAARPAISNLGFQVNAGGVTGLVGPDGAGKTTLLRLLAALLLPTSGKAIVCGHDTAGGDPNIRQVVSYMPQRFGLYEDLTVQENLRLYADLRGVVGDARREAFGRLLAFTNLAPFTDRLAGNLSGGMKQKLGLACALVQTPRLLLLDEPSVGVDPISRRELWRMVYDLVDQGIGVIWSTAYLDEAERCREVVLLNEGEALYIGPPKELTRRIAGRVFLISDLGPSRRKVLANLLHQSGIVDGVVQGSNLRVVIAEGSSPPEPATLRVEQATVNETAPRFEDAFVDLLGGERQEQSQLGASFQPGAATMDSVIDADGLTKRFGNFTAVDHVSFHVKRGEIYGLLGPNGAGKSTTFKMMCGLLRPTAGGAHVAGFDLYRAAAAARQHLGYMAQKFSLYGDLSVRENLNFFSGVYGLRGHARQEIIQQMIDTFELNVYLERNAGDMPLGFKQRLALACAIMHSPPVLFLDEPTSGVDPLTRREFWSHINAMVGRGVTVMITTHFLDEAEYCDRVGLVYKGHLIAQGTPDELKDSVRGHAPAEPTLEDAFVELVEQYDREHTSDGQ